MSFPKDLAALLQTRPTPAARDRALSALDAIDDLQPLAQRLHREGVDILALDALTRLAPEHTRAAELAEILRPGRRRAAAIHLAQEVALANTRAALDEASIPYVVIKGAHLGRVLYDDPLQRVGVDVDVLVAPEDKARAIAALTDRGFQAKARAQTATHEINFTDGRAWIDLHWHFLRPGRTRRPVEGDILITRQTIDGVSVPDDIWTTVIMLVHNAITDTVTARANRAVDLARWVSSRALDWDAIARRVAAMGLIAAAWATLTWVDELLGLDLDTATVSALRPPLIQRAYLRAWLRADPSALYRDHPHLVRFGFGLALHDTPQDALRFALRFIATAPERRHAPTKR